MPRTTEKNKLSIHIRWMIHRDFPDLASIERACLDAWSEDEYRTCLCKCNCIGMVAEIEPFSRQDGLGRTLGAMVYELHKRRLEVLRLVVHPDWRRRGVGRAMLTKLKNKLSSHRRRSLAVNVHEADLSAHLFLRAEGFRAEDVLRAEECYRFVYRVKEGF